MIIPSGVTFNIGRAEYCEGMELPANAPAQFKKLCAERAAELAKEAKKEPEKPDPKTPAKEEEDE